MGNDAPLFPKTKMSQGEDNDFKINGLAVSIPVLTAKIIISFRRWQSRLTVSRQPLAAIDLMVSIVLTAELFISTAFRSIAMVLLKKRDLIGRLRA